MKKLTKALSAVLLLAVVISAFGVFSAFADGAETSTEFTTLYDMDAQTSITVSNVGTDNYPQTYPTMTKGEEDGQTKWTLSMGDAQVGDSGNSGDFWSIDGLGWSIRVRDDAGYGTRAGGEKNTDYVILDFDIATDTEFIDDIYINARFLASGAAAYNKNLTSAAGAYPAFRRADDGSLIVSNDKGANPVSPMYPITDKWADVTLIYDFSNDTENYLYVYIDGYYCGNIAAPAITSAVFYFARVQTINDNTVDMAGTSTSFANLTLKQVPAGYEGVMTQRGALGSAVHLAAIPELSYCVEGKPGTPEGYEAISKLADIKRGEETIPVYDVDDLHGDLLDGDVVTVYADVAALKGGAFMIKEASEGVAANVVWQDANGATLGAEGSLFAAPAVVSVPYAAAWAMLKGDVLSSGSQSEYDADTTYLYDTLWESIVSDSGVKDVVLFEDYIMYGRSYGITGSTSSGSNDNRVSSGSITVDMNGHTLTNAAKRTHIIYVYGSNISIVFKNGNLVHSAGGNNLVMGSKSGQHITVENCNVTIDGGTIFDQRAGIVLYRDCVIDTKSTLSNVKATGNSISAIYVIDCDITATTSLANLAQTNESGVGRYGSGVLVATYVNTKISGGTLADGDIYADVGHSGTAAYAQNLVNHYVSAIGCEFESTGRLTLSEVLGVPAEGETVLTARYMLSLVNSKIKASTLAYINQSNADTTRVDYYASINVKNTVLDLSAALTEGKSIASDVDVSLAKGTVAAEIPVGDSVINPTINIPEGCTWAHTSFLKGGYILTDSTETYTYQYGTGEINEIEWNNPADGTEDPVAIYDIAPLASLEGVYTYEWVQDGNAFNTKFIPDPSLRPDAKATLSLTDGFILNVYIPDDNAYSYAARDIYGNALTGYGVTLDGAAYTKFSSKGVSPTRTENTALTLDLTVSGVYGDTAIVPIDYSVMDYIAAYTVDETTSDEVLVKAIINYIYSAYVYAGMDTASLEQYKPEGDYTMVEDGAIIESLPGVKISVNYDEYLAWGIKATEGTRLTISYYDYTSGDAGAVLCEKSVIMPESGIVYVPMSAMNFASEITVTKGDESASVNLAGYYSRIIQDDAKAMVAAIYHYAKAAYDYISVEFKDPSTASDGTLSADGKTLTYTDKLFIDVELDFLNTGFGSAEHIVFNNCTFLMTETAYSTYVGGGDAQGSVKSYTFDGCSFKMSAANTNGKYALALVGGENAPDYTVKNCTFNAPRGINLTASYGAPVYGNITIEGNTFTPGDNDAPVAIQIAAAADTALVADAIAIKNNVFECGIAIRAHETLEATYADGAGLAALTGLVTFGGNTLAEYATAVTDDGTDATVAIASAWSAKFR